MPGTRDPSVGGLGRGREAILFQASEDEAVDGILSPAGAGDFWQGGALGRNEGPVLSGFGGLGVIGASFVPPDEVAAVVAQARAITAKPIGINLLLHATEERLEEILEHEPAVFSTAWPRDDQDLATIFARVPHSSRWR